MDENSSAAKQGLKEGDRVIEVNGIDFEKITKSSAENLLGSMNKLKVVAKSSASLPEMDVSNSW